MDDAGLEAARVAQQLGISIALLQSDDRNPTGEARVSFDEFGSPTFTFLSPAAWDFIEPRAAAMLAISGADATIFGTLAQRTARSHQAIIELVDAARFRVFDPNLRRPHIDRETTLQSLSRADLIKVSDDECTVLAGWLGVADNPGALLDALSRTRTGFSRPPLELCITCGSRGALYHADGQWHTQAAVPTQVADTVGAGDAFLAMLVAQRLKGTAPDTALRRATSLAAFVVSQPGAVPDYDAQAFLAD
jgi:fructokinase